jgi:rod shape-determining protein MreC
VIAVALVSLAQIDAARTGKPSVIAVAITTVAGVAQSAISATAGGVHWAIDAVASIPRLAPDNAALRAQNLRLTAENARLTEALSRVPDALAIAGVASELQGTTARTIAFDPEGETRLARIDRGSQSGVRADAGVINGDGAVGRIVEVTPFFSTVQLLTDPASKIPALVQRGRWWGIAVGAGSRLEMRFIAQDAKLRPGDTIVTGEGRSFPAGIALGTIRTIGRAEGGLYQTAIVDPAVSFGRLGAVLVLSR